MNREYSPTAILTERPKNNKEIFFGDPKVVSEVRNTINEMFNPVTMGREALLRSAQVPKESTERHLGTSEAIKLAVAAGTHIVEARRREATQRDMTLAA